MGKTVFVKVVDKKTRASLLRLFKQTRREIDAPPKSGYVRREIRLGVWDVGADFGESDTNDTLDQEDLDYLVKLLSQNPEKR